MAEWVWEGKTRAGEIKKRVIVAPNEREANNRLRQQGIMPENVRARRKQYNLEFLTPGVSPAKLVVFVRQFATMIDAGLPLVQCLEILSSQESNRTFQKVLVNVKESVESGATFADSLKKHPKVFDTLFVNLVAAGELGGILDTILNRLATYIEKNVKLARQVKGAVIYPIAICLVAVGVVTALLKWVIPTFESMFRDFGDKKLPALTEHVINLSHWFGQYFFLIALATGGLIYLLVRLFRTKKGRRFFDALFLKLPLFGSLLRKVAVAKFTRTLGTMIASGVPLLDALEVVSKAANNAIIEEAILFTRDKISEGSSMAEPLAKTGVFPGMVVQMIGVGESTGAMDTMLQKVADFYEDEVEVAVGSLTKLLEPLMMVFIGGIVGTVIVAMYLPVFEIAGNMKGG